MKARFHTLLLLWILTGGLLFSQVGAGYFHNKHDAHKETHILDAGKFAIQEHGEHCKLCAIDLIHLYLESHHVCLINADGNSAFLSAIPGTPLTATTPIKDRSPPVII
jgi:hypothetical protein